MRCGEHYRNAVLKARGWQVVRVWEHESLSSALDRIEEAIAAQERRRILADCA